MVPTNIPRRTKDTVEPSPDLLLRRAVAWVAGFNLLYFFIEFTVALIIGSVSLFADSIDFLEDTSINVLILVALGWTVRRRAKAGMVMAGFILIPGIATLWQAVGKILNPEAPDPFSLSATALGAAAVNLTCALLLARHRHHGGSMGKAAYLSARNDIAANLAIIAAGFATLWLSSGWPDIVVGLGIAALNAGAAKEVWDEARKEHLGDTAVEA